MKSGNIHCMHLCCLELHLRSTACHVLLLPACLPAHAEHLGEHSTYTLPQYLAIGQCDGGLSAEQIFAVISNAIFVNRVSTCAGHRRAACHAHCVL
jgi:hypothetical protein